jgi:hypothetical protein
MMQVQQSNRPISVIIDEQKRLYGFSYITGIYSYSKFTCVQLDGMWYELYMDHDHSERWLSYMNKCIPVRVNGNQIEAVAEKYVKYNKLVKIQLRSKNLSDMMFDVIEENIITIDIQKAVSVWVCLNKVGDVFHGTMMKVGSDSPKIDEKLVCKGTMIDIEIKEKPMVQKQSETNFITAMMITNSIPNTVSPKFIVFVRTFFEEHPSAIFECAPVTDFQINNLCSWISLLKDNIDRDDYNKLIRKILGEALTIREADQGKGVYVCNMLIKRLCELM